jgi:hypothetical protein
VNWVLLIVAAVAFTLGAFGAWLDANGQATRTEATAPELPVLLPYEPDEEQADYQTTIDRLRDLEADAARRLRDLREKQ